MIAAIDTKPRIDLGEVIAQGVIAHAQLFSQDLRGRARVRHYDFDHLTLLSSKQAD